MTVRVLSSVCVYCGSSSGSAPEFAEVARDLGTALAERRLRLVYGGGATGLMGATADAAIQAGGEVVGVMPRGLFRREVAHQGLTQLIEVSSMHERKAKMFELAGAFVGLPGGLGTLEELTEMATWAQLGLHTKPIVTLDVNGFWSPFHDLLRRIAAAGLIAPENLGLVVNVADLAELWPALEAYSVPYRDKWIDP